MFPRVSQRILFLAFAFCYSRFAITLPQNSAPPEGAEQVKLSEILIPLSVSATPEEVASAEKEAKEVIDQLNAGVPFEQEARQHSKGPTAAQGGNVGYFARGVLSSQSETQVFDLKVGSVTGPIRTKQGLAIIKVTDRSTGAPKNSQGMVDILTDTEGVDFGPYLSSALVTIRKNWYESMPDEAKPPLRKQGAVTIICSIRKNGVIEGMTISSPSGDPELDRAVWEAINASSPLQALPSKFTKDSLKLLIRFYYNPTPNPPILPPHH